MYGRLSVSPGHEETERSQPFGGRRVRPPPPAAGPKYGDDGRQRLSKVHRLGSKRIWFYAMSGTIDHVICLRHCRRRFRPPSYKPSIPPRAVRKIKIPEKLHLFLHFRLYPARAGSTIRIFSFAPPSSITNRVFVYTPSPITVFSLILSPSISLYAYFTPRRRSSSPNKPSVNLLSLILPYPRHTQTPLAVRSQFYPTAHLP